MVGTSSGACKRLTAADFAACAPLFGFAGDVDGFARFICEQQAKADMAEQERCLAAKA